MKSKHQEIADAWVECRNAWTERDEAVKSLAAVTAERDAYLETIRATFRVLESRGHAPDDNAPLSVTVRRVLDFLDTVTAERDAALAKLAALKKRLADAPKTHAQVQRLEDGET